MEKIKQVKGGINKMKKTGMFLAVLLVASLFASGFALAESFAVTGKSVGLDSNSGASISAEEFEMTTSFSSKDIEEVISDVNSGVGIRKAAPGFTTRGQGWIATNDERTAFIHGIWTERKTSDDKISSGKIRIGAKTYKLGEGKLDSAEGSWNFVVYGHEGQKGHLYLDLTNQIGNMKFWNVAYNLGDDSGKGEITTKTHRVRKSLPKPATESEDDSGVSFGNEAPAKEKKKGFFGRIFGFFGKK
jgi:hypothetical protein